MKLNYESYSSCCVGVWVAHPNDVWERAGIGASLGGSRDLQQGYVTSKEDAGGAGTQVENIFFFSPARLGSSFVLSCFLFEHFVLFVLS